MVTDVLLRNSMSVGLGGCECGMSRMRRDDKVKGRAVVARASVH